MSRIDLSSETTVIFADVRVLNPALDTNPEETLILGVTLPMIRTKFDRKGNVAGKTPDMGLCILSTKKFDPETKRFTDQPEIFECSLEEFTKRGWFARIPVTPITQRWSASKILEYLEGRAPTVGPYEVYRAVLDEWNYFIDFGGMEGADVFNAVWDIGTYFHALFDYYPYIKFGGERGVGKTKAGSLHAALAFNGDISARATPASIYRFAGDTRGTQVIDEQERLTSNKEEMTAYYQVLNSGFHSSGACNVTNKDTLKVERFPTYSPKVICSIGGLRETLSDRSYEIILLRSTDRSITDREVPPPDRPRWKPIRDSLYLLLLQKWTEVQATYRETENIHSLDGRNWNLAKPLITVAQFLDRYTPNDEQSIKQSLVNFIKRCIERKKGENQETNSAIVLTALHSLLKSHTDKEPSDYRFAVKVREVVDRAVEQEGEWIRDYLKPRRTAQILKNLKLYDNPRKSTGGYYTFETSLSDVTSTAERYGIQLESEESGDSGHSGRSGRKIEGDGSAGKTSGNTLQSTLSQPTPPKNRAPHLDESPDPGNEKSCQSKRCQLPPLSPLSQLKGGGPRKATIIEGLRDLLGSKNPKIALYTYMDVKQQLFLKDFAKTHEEADRVIAQLKKTGLLREDNRMRGYYTIHLDGEEV